MADSDPRRISYRIAVSLAFFINGAGFACIACRLPDIQKRLNLDEGQLGLALFACAVGAFLGVGRAGRACARLGTHRVVLWFGLGTCLFLSLLPFATAYWVLCLVFAAFGACAGTMDMAMNANGVSVEKLFPKPIMSSLHGMFSLGGLFWAGVGWTVVKLGVSAQAHFVGASLVLGLLVVWLVPRLLRSTPDPSQLGPPFAFPSRSVLVIGLIAFCAFLCEGAMGDWSAIYLQRNLHQTPAYSTLGYLAFTLTMTITRFGGDAVLHRWGPTRTLRVSGLITFLGLGAALWFGIPWLTVVGFASVGLGMATAAPIAFSLGGRIGGDDPAHAIASIAMLGYLAFLIGPALIGFLARLTSLRDALVLVVILAFAIVVLAGFAARSSD
jgi:MFS family permease